ncbi:hypothetical protein GALL_476410 [mine drainage metagenome]|uniref:Uncharacterized protein n=1 Tax=mine drainage metagenome TaxID=410659 RepID=A0A1J5PH21_9ZZZZ
MRAQLAYQSLGQHAQQRRTQQKRLNAHVGQARDGAGGIVGVQGGEHQVAGQRGLNRNLRGLKVTDFTDHDDVRVLPQNGAQGLGKVKFDLRVDLGLPDTGEFILDRVFDGHDVVAPGVQPRQRRIQGGGFARAGRAGDQHNAVRLGHQRLKAAQHLALHAQRFQTQAAFGFVQQAQHRTLAMGAGDGRHPHIHRPGADAQGDAPVLRQPALGNVKLGHDLQAGNQRRMQRTVGLHHLAQRAIHPKTHAGVAFIGLDVDVAGTVARSLRQQRVQHADDWRVIGRLQQVFNRRQVLHHA